MTIGEHPPLTRRLAAALAAVAAVAGCGSDPTSEQIVEGLSQPRGIAIDGSSICVAEAGSIPPEGPTVERDGQIEADTGRVLCGSDGEEFETVLSDLPFVYYPTAAVTSGTADVVHDDGMTYALIGESYGELSRSIVLVTEHGPEVIADLLAFATSRAPADDAGIRSNPWSMVPDRQRNGFLVADAATGQVLRAGSDGTIEVFAPVPGHEVLTGMAWGPDGRLYAASFGQLPHQLGTGAVVAIEADGSSKTIIDGLTMAIDVGFDTNGGMFVLEYSTPPDEPEGVDAYRDATGRLSYVPDLTRPAERRMLLEHLDRPTALALGRNTLLLSIAAGEQAAGDGEVREYPLDSLLAD